MSKNKFILITCIAFGIMFCIAGFFYMTMEAEFSTDISAHRGETTIPFIALAFLILTLIISYLYPKSIQANKRIANWIRYGALIGIVWLLPQGNPLYEKTTNLMQNGIVGFAIYNMIELAIGKLIITLFKEKNYSESILINLRLTKNNRE